MTSVTFWLDYYNALLVVAMSSEVVSRLSFALVLLLATGQTAGDGCVDASLPTAELEQWTDEVPQDSTLVVQWSTNHVSPLYLSRVKAS